MEHYILSEQDLALIRQRRGANNRIGMAVQLAFLRFPGRALQPDETPPDELLSSLAAQLKADGRGYTREAAIRPNKHHRTGNRIVCPYSPETSAIARN
jgi:TnpA family transposase